MTLTTSHSNSTISSLLGYLALWVGVVFACRALQRNSPKNAASLVSLTYCATTVLWSVGALSAVPVPSNPFDYDLSPALELRANATLDAAAPASVMTLALSVPLAMSMRDYILFSIAYFSTDLLFDWDPRFVAHHLLSLCAMVTTLLYPHLEVSSVSRVVYCVCANAA
jgi:hypothetical protein